MLDRYSVGCLPFEMTMTWSLADFGQRPALLFGEAWNRQPIPFFRREPQHALAERVDLPFFKIDSMRGRLMPSDDSALQLPVRGSGVPERREWPRLTVLDIAILDPRILVEAHVDDDIAAIVSGPWSMPGSASSFRRFGVPVDRALSLTARTVGKKLIEEAVVFLRLGFGLPRQPV